MNACCGKTAYATKSNLAIAIARPITNPTWFQPHGNVHWTLADPPKQTLHAHLVDPLERHGVDDDETVVVEGDEKDRIPGVVRSGTGWRRQWRSWIPIGVGAEAVNRSRGFFKRNKSENGEKTNGGRLALSFFRERVGL